MAVKLNADLRTLFTWNTKQLFVFIAAEYETDANRLNTVALWDRIIEHKAAAHLQLPYIRQKYRFVDQGHSLRGRAVNLTLAWNMMPFAGGLLSGRHVVSGAVLPANYTPPPGASEQPVSTGTGGEGVTLGWPQEGGGGVGPESMAAAASGKPQQP